MDLREFVAMSLTQIAQGVKDANGEGANFSLPSGIADDTKVMFDVAVTAHSKTSGGGEASLAIAGVLTLGGSGDRSAATEHVSRVRFGVQVEEDLK